MHCRSALLTESPCLVLQVAFADEACMPKHARFAHAAAPINAFEPLGEIRLQACITGSESLARHRPFLPRQPHHSHIFVCLFECRPCR